MIALIQTLNHWGGQALTFAWPMLWQSSLLIAVLFALDLSLRVKVRAAVRYALWLVVLVKLVLPPSLALPTSAAWWLRSGGERPKKPQRPAYIVRSEAATVPVPPLEMPITAALIPTPKPRLSVAGWALTASTSFSALLLSWMLFRWCQILRRARRAIPAPEFLDEMATGARVQAKLPRYARIKLTEQPLSPAVCGLFRPVILFPAVLMNRLAPAQLRAVLLHESFHIRRGDVWVNLLQSLLQIFYWWHPLLWLANARIRRLREEAVDDCVMLALENDAGSYAPTLLEVAKMTLQRPLASLGLVGIVESKSSLRRRIERLLNFRSPSRPGLTFQAIVGIFAFSALALPMGEATVRPHQTTETAQTEIIPWPDYRFTGYREVDLEANFFSADAAALQGAFPALLENNGPLVLGANDLASVRAGLKQASIQPIEQDETLRLQHFSGGRFRYWIGGGTNYVVSYETREFGGNGVTTGAQIELPSASLDWIPLEFSVAPWAEGDSIRCQIELSNARDSNILQQAEVSVPEGGAVLWAISEGMASGKRQIVMLARYAAASSIDQIANTGAPPDTQSVSSNLAPLRAWIASHNSKQEALTPTNSTGLAPYPISRIDLQSHTDPKRGLPNVRVAGRKAIVSMLQSIQLDKGWNGLPLSEVIKDLGNESKLRDPKRQGINFILNPSVYPDESAATRYIDPTTGLPIAVSPPTEQFDGGATRITVNPPLNDVRLIDLLDAIVKGADHPIKYSIETYAVVFSVFSPTEPQPLFVRSFKIDLESLRPVLQEALAGVEPTQPQVTVAPCVDVFGRTDESCVNFMNLRAFLLAQGVDLTPPKSVFYGDLEGTLLVRATQRELERIEAAIQNLTNCGILSPKPTTVPKAIPSAGHVVDSAGRNSASTPAESSAPVDQSALSTNSSGSQTQLFTRSFRLDPQTVKRNLDRAIQNGSDVAYGSRSIKSKDDSLNQLREFLAKAGVDFTPPKNVYWNYHEGVLLCRASTHELDIIEKELQTLNVPADQLNLRVRFVEIEDEPAKRMLGLLEWLSVHDGLRLATNTTSPNLLASPLSPRTKPLSGQNPPTNSVALTIMVSLGIAQNSTVSSALQQSGGTFNIADQTITTLIGRQNEAQAVNEISVVTAPDWVPQTPSTSTNLYQPERVAIGPVLNVTPEVEGDGLSIKLSLVGTVKDFLGYDDPRHDFPNALALQPLPHFRIRQISTSARVRDGQTLLLIGLVNDEDIKRFKKAVPVLGALPAFGRLFRQESTVRSKKHLLILITPTLIDPAGNRIHGDNREPPPQAK